MLIYWTVRSSVSCAVLWICACIPITLASWIDSDTPSYNRQTRSFTDGEIYDIVMSDEFNRDGREFKDGYDPMWTGESGLFQCQINISFLLLL